MWKISNPTEKLRELALEHLKSHRLGSVFDILLRFLDHVSNHLTIIDLSYFLMHFKVADMGHLIPNYIHMHH